MNTTEVVAIVTGASTLLAGGGTAGLASFLGRRDARHRARLEAYERLANAAQVLVLRATGYRMQASLGAVASTVLQGGTRYFLVIWLLGTSKTARNFLGLEGAIALSKTLQIPPPEPGSVTQVTLGEAFEEVIAAAGAVHVRGSQAARDKSDALLDACRAYTGRTLIRPKLLDVAQGLLSGGDGKKPWLTPVELSALTEAIDKARSEFLDVARREEKTL